MSDYTPSRSVVREAYIASREFAFFCDEDYRRLARAEFDRWLAKERRKAKAEGWDEGYAQGDADQLCHCNAYNEYECACFNFGNQRTVNPYRGTP